MSLDLIKSIREKTGLSFKDIKEAVSNNSSASEQEIIDELRKQGVLKQQKRQDRTTAQGSVFAYVHEGRIGVLLEVKCETDFVARSDAFQEFGNNVALHIAAYRPQFVSPEDVSPEFITKELEIAKEQLIKEGKPENIIDKILEGKKKKISEENALVSQNFLKDPTTTVNEQLTNLIQSTGEKVEISRFTIFNLS